MRNVIIDHHELITGQIQNVFETMLSLPVVPCEAKDFPDNLERVVGTIGVAGSEIAGAIHTHWPLKFAELITEQLLGTAPPSKESVNDVIGEISNMVAAGVKTAYCDAGAACSISVPGIIRGTFTVINAQKNKREVFSYRSGEHIFAVELHWKQLPAGPA